MFIKLYEMIKKFIKENIRFLCALAFLFLFFFYQLPFVIYRPGGTIDLKDRIVMDDPYPTSGKLSMAYVSMMKGNIPFVLLSFVLPNWDLEKTSEITLDNESIDDTILRDHLYLEEGLDNATISAYQAANKEINIKKKYPVVSYITKEAQTNLKVGDIILKVNQQEFEELAQLQEYINSLQKDDSVAFEVERDGKKVSCTATVYEIDNTLKVGISILTKYEYDASPSIEIKTKDSESGSSGGLMTALSIYNALTEEDITKGRNIIGTGTIDILGNVGEIGGVKYKLLGAEKEGADIFLCPKENYEEAKKVKEQNDLNIELIAVSTLEEAIEVLTK